MFRFVKWNTPLDYLDFRFCNSFWIRVTWTSDL